MIFRNSDDKDHILGIRVSFLPQHPPVDLPPDPDAPGRLACSFHQVVDEQTARSFLDCLIISDGCTSFARFKKYSWEKKCFDWQKAFNMYMVATLSLNKKISGKNP